MTDTTRTIDLATLESYLSEELDAVVVGTEVLQNGLNLSVAVSTEEDGRAFVVRRPNGLRHGESFIDVTREFGVLQRLEASGIPAPDPVLLCEDESVIGGPFLVATYLEGETIPMGTALSERFRTPIARRTVATIQVDTLATIHTADVDRFVDSCRRRPMGERVDSVIDQLEGATRVTGHDLPALRDVGMWIRENVPPDSTPALVHGD